MSTPTPPLLRQHASTESLIARRMEEILTARKSLDADGLELWGMAVELQVMAVDLADLAADQELAWQLGRFGRKGAATEKAREDIQQIERQQDEMLIFASSLRDLWVLVMVSIAVLASMPQPAESPGQLKAAQRAEPLYAAA